MKLELVKPLVFFDLETTGINIQRDRIVEICAIKVMPDGNREEYYALINPLVKIPKAASAIHGITDQDVADKPSMLDLASEINDFFANSDVSGYNILRFDVPFLAEELLRTGIEKPLEDAQFIDVMTIFHRKVPRSLAGAMLYYRNETIENAHSAKADVEATIKVLESQMERHDDLPVKSDELANYVLDGKGIVDFAGYFRKDDSGDIVFNFGKHKGKKVETEQGYLQWMLNSDFPEHTKRSIQKILNPHPNLFNQ